MALLTRAAAGSRHTAPAVAARWYAAALALLPANAGPRRVALLGPMALAQADAGQLAASRNTLLEALAALPDAPTPQRWGLVAGCAMVEFQLGRHLDARRRLLAAHEQASTEHRAGFALGLAAGAFWSGEPAEQRAWARRALDDAPPGEPALAVGAEALLGLGALWAGDASAARSALDAAGVAFVALGDGELAGRLDAAMYVALAQVMSDSFSEAVATGSRAVELARRTGQGTLVVPLENTLAMAFRCLGDLEATRLHGEAAEETARLRGTGNQLQFALWLRATHHQERGEWEQAEAAPQNAPGSSTSWSPAS